MFGYTCEDCHEGTVRATEVEDYETAFEAMPFTVPKGVIGVCDACGAKYFSGRERMRWKKLFHQWQEERGDLMTAAGIRALRERLGMTKTDFARLIGATRQSLYYWEKDDRDTPQSRSIDLLLKLVQEGCEQGQVDVVEFLRDCAVAAGIELSAPPGDDRRERLRARLGRTPLQTDQAELERMRADD